MAGVCDINIERLLTSTTSPGTATVEHVASDLTMGLITGKGIDLLNHMLSTPLATYFTEANMNIQRIMGQQLLPETEIDINKRLNLFICWLKEVYMVHRNSEDTFPNKELYVSIEEKIGNLTDLISDLSNNNYAESTFSVYIIAANLHLLMLQELAILDPESIHPLMSKHNKVICNIAIEYAKHGQKCYDNVVKRRVKMVTEVVIVSDRLSNPVPALVYTAVWMDEFTNLIVDDKVTKVGTQWPCGTIKLLRELAIKNRQIHIRNITNEARKDMNSPLVVISAWRSRLQKFPLPLFMSKYVKPEM